MEKLSIPVTKEVKDMASSLAKDIKDLEKAIPPSNYSPKKKEEEKAPMD